MASQKSVGIFLQEAFGSFALLLMVFPFNSFLGDTWSSWIQHFFSVMITDYTNGGAQVNPAMSVGTFFYGWNDRSSLMIRVVAQMVGGFYAFPIMAKLLPSYATASMGGPTLAAGASTGEGMAWEFGSTLALILIVYAAATQIGLPGQRPVIATGIRALIHLSAVKGGKTGPAMNPMIATAWAVYDSSVTMDAQWFLVYWVAPCAAAVAGTLLWKSLEPKPKAKTD
ncbi:unnamed protein product [Pylaiella littoralis]